MECSFILMIDTITIIGRTQQITPILIITSVQSSDATRFHKCRLSNGWTIFLTPYTFPLKFKAISCVYVPIFLFSYTIFRTMQINNAGSNAYSYKPLAEASDEDLV